MTGSEKRVARTNLVVLQPTSFCNLDCRYCYVADRSNKARTSDAVLEAIFTRLAASPLIEDQIEILWHAGEPLAAGIDFYAKAVAEQKRAFGDRVTVTNTIQTNATLVTTAWCDFLTVNGFKVGVSLDGPPHLNDLNRTYRGGRGSYDKVMTGVDRLKAAGLSFGVLMVVTRAHLEHADEIYAYIKAQGFRWVGFNIEENEGENRISSLAAARDMEAYRRFFERLYSLWTTDDAPFVVREFDDFLSSIYNVRKNKAHVRSPDEVRALAILTIDRDGEIYTFSPELASTRSARYGSFSLGNVLDTPIDERLLDRRPDIVAGVAAGVRNCHLECPIFAFCGGAYVSNRVTEHDDLNVAGTNACELHRKLLFEVVLTGVEAQGARTAAPSDLVVQ